MVSHIFSIYNTQVHLLYEWHLVMGLMEQHVCAAKVVQLHNSVWMGGKTLN